MKAIIGQPFTFTALFLDDLNQPVSVLSPTIEVFYFNDLGEKVYTIPTATPLPSVVPAELGRYAYAWTIPGNLTIRNTLYSIMKGTNPLTMEDMVVETHVDLFTEDEGTSNTDGLRASFVKP